MKFSVLVQLLPHDLERVYSTVGICDFFTQQEPWSGLCFRMFAIALSCFQRALSQDLQEVAVTELYYLIVVNISVLHPSGFSSYTISG